MILFHLENFPNMNDERGYEVHAMYIMHHHRNNNKPSEPVYNIIYFNNQSNSATAKHMRVIHCKKQIKLITFTHQIVTHSTF